MKEGVRDEEDTKEIIPRWTEEGAFSTSNHNKLLLNTVEPR
jgi:hypothetical protein